MCGHGRAAVEAFLGRVSKGQKNVALGEAVAEGSAAEEAGRCWVPLEIEVRGDGWLTWDIPCRTEDVCGPIGGSKGVRLRQL